MPAAALMSGFYLNELLLKGLARQDPHPTLFDAYADTLAALAASPASEAGNDAESALRAFELVLLRELGLLPELDTLTATGEALRPDRRYALHPEAGMQAEALIKTGERTLPEYLMKPVAYYQFDADRMFSDRAYHRYRPDFDFERDAPLLRTIKSLERINDEPAGEMLKND